MALTFEIGDPGAPRGHAVLYFRSSSLTEGAQVLATYVLVLPVQMDMGKYLPPLLASQLGGAFGEAMGEGMGSFAAPPMPEPVESVEYLRELAALRGDDLITPGSVVLGDAAAAMQETAEAVQEYARLYDQHVDANGPHTSVTASASIEQGGSGEQGESAEAGERGGASVQHVLYELMSERDRLGELSKLVGTLRFAMERDDKTLTAETEASLSAMERLLPEHYWGDKVHASAGDMSDNGAKLAQLYVERCYKLLDEDFGAVEEIERSISAILG
ncbi:MAG: hypothetical protein V3S98_06740 [Dehalococcoidia bacterium]